MERLLVRFPKHIQVKQTITGPHMLARFSVNKEKDLYKDDQSLAMAYADALIKVKMFAMRAVEYIQFDEPVWTENVSESDWGADVLNYIIGKFPRSNLIYIYVEEMLIGKRLFWTLY